MILEDKNRTLTALDAYNFYKKGQFKPVKGARLNLGFSSSVYWMAVEVPPVTDSTYLIMGSPLINLLDVYQYHKGFLIRRYQTGDHRKFASRPIPHPLYILPLQTEKKSNSLYLIRVDKHNESLQLSLSITKAYEFNQKTNTNNFLNGILCGGVCLLVIFGLFLYVTVKDKLYLYYVLYLIFVYLWVIADKGYGYQYLWPESIYFASRSRPVFNCLFAIMLLHFMQAFIGQTKESKLYRPINWLKVFLFSMLSLFLVPVNYVAYPTLVLFLLKILLVAGLSTTLLMILSIIEKIKSGNREAWFYLISTLALLTCAMSEIMVQAGSSDVANNYLSNFGIQTGIFIEAVILIFGLAYRFNTYRKDREQLLIAFNKKQEQLTESILETKESERRIIADQLHDDVGAMLSIATLQVSTALDARGLSNEKTPEKLQHAQDVLKDISQTIRTLSHNLTPWAIEKFGIKKALQDLIYKINISDKISLESTMLGFENPEAYPVYFLNDLFRIIQELLNNILKHAAASHAYLEIIEHSDTISIIIEDNGNGFDQQGEAVKGKGLESIRSKIAFYEGEVELNSILQQGTTVVINIPIKKENPEDL
ncbi:histidine kinase [Pedobacter sp. MC2016-14]|uniref:sensor histidine kinase n=1 Tax=Pedobacter sp. MC2016-14 TaxID=2897327 RepID=UPI001E5CF823|nr:7TM diverse intracellular signaling domain-containing protein [Pedobacter sp. MC2016-14]MCD0489987.1 histidine kinase [Pedobacter sp. MC2016-14]